MIIRQNGKPRIATDKGKVIAEFDKNGIAKVDDKIGAKLVKLGYAADTVTSDKSEELPVSLFGDDTNGGAADDANGETEAQTSGSK